MIPYTRICQLLIDHLKSERIATVGDPENYHPIGCAKK